MHGLNFPHTITYLHTPLRRQREGRWVDGGLQVVDDIKGVLFLGGEEKHKA